MVTREDVANKAGVSVSAVSRTMNGRGYVAKEKKEAILNAVKELGYRPNPLSNSLKIRQTFQLCYFTVNIFNSFYMDSFNFMSEQAAKRGYSMFLLNHFNADQMRHLLMDGMILSNEADALEFQDVLGEQFYLPLVSTSFGLPVIKTRRIPYIDVDTYNAMEMALDYLFKMGHHKIAYGTPYSLKNQGTIQSRNVAFENIMRPVYGKKLSDYILCTNRDTGKKNMYTQESFFEEGMNTADLFIQSGCNATGIVCFNDEFALGFMNRMIRMGYRVPEDISIVGIDGVSKRKYTSPLLTSVALNIKEQAYKGVDTLIDIIDGKRVSSVTSISPYLLEGESVKKL